MYRLEYKKKKKKKQKILAIIITSFDNKRYALYKCKDTGNRATTIIIKIFIYFFHIELEIYSFMQ